MTIQQMAAFAEMLSTASGAAMVLVGGVKALASVFGVKEPSAEEMAAITALQIADASRRANERRAMAGM